jgi:hypothetical protein
MPQVTPYPDDETAALLAPAASASGLSRSRWAAQEIRSHAGDAWPDGCWKLAGAFPEFPLQDRGRDAQGSPDVPRVGF